MKNKLNIPILKNSNNSNLNNVIDIYQYINGNKICTRIINNIFGIHLTIYNVQ